MEEKRIRTALLLMSGGLDSQLASRVLQSAGARVKAVIFDSPFFDSEKGRQACYRLELPYVVFNFTSDIIELINNPPHGFGSCMNPCIDCHARMLKRAGEMLDEQGCDFIATGEVLDQRPMSQNKRSLATVAKDSGFAELLVRPLSARLLEPTLPETMGWLDREKLLDLRGRGRKRQFEFAKEFGVKEYPSPAGGCRLTEPEFCVRLKDMKEHEGLAGVRDIELLKVGRHFRIGPATKLIVGRDARENAVIEASRELYDLMLKVESVPGPSALLPLTASEAELQLAARICASYSDSPRDGQVVLRVKSARGTDRITVSPVPRSEIEPLRL